MKLSKIPLVTSFYKDEDRDWSVQDCVNYLPTVSESTGTRSQMMLRTAPGLRPFVHVPDSGPVRGVYNCEGRLFAVLGDKLYQINNNLVAVPIGIIPGTQRVQFAHNQASSTGANQLVIGNGQAGYVYNTQTKVFERITDEGFIGGISPVFIDSYIVWVSLNRLYALNSSPANALEYNTLDQFQSEFSPDKLVALAVSSSELILMSETSLEFFQNTGATEQPFRTKQISLSIGVAGRFCKAFSDNTVFFLANDGTFRRIDNYTATRISTGPVEQAIRGLDWTQAYTYVWEEGRYKVVYWTFPDGKTFGWDIANQAWHRRESYGLNRWRVSDITKWNGLNIAGDFQDGTLWVVDSAYMMEGDQDFMCEISGPVIHADGNLAKMPRLDVIMQTGQQDTVFIPFPIQPPAPIISGPAPNAAIGAPYSHTFTATSGTPPYVFSVSSGDLPPGLSLNVSGLLSGNPSSLGRWSFVVRVTDSNGIWDEVNNTITVSMEWWMVTNSVGLTDRAWISTDLSTWSSPLSRSPSAIVPSFAALGARAGFAVISSATTAAETDSTTPVGAVINNTPLTLPIANPLRFRRFGALIFAIPETGSTYGLSQDGGATWSAVTTDHEIRDIGRLANGRWVTYAQSPPPAGMRYSNQAVPTVWTVGTTGDIASGDGIIGTSGNTVIVPLTLNRFWVSQDGASYAVIAPVSAANSPTPRGSASLNGTIYFVGQHATSTSPNIIWSSDAGLTWQGHRNFEAGSFMNIWAADGKLVASGNGVTGAGSSPFSYRIGNVASWIDGEAPFSLESSKTINIFPVER